MSTESPPWGDLLAELADSIIGRIRVSAPARVISYDPGTGRAIVQPMIGLRLRVPDGDGYILIASPQVEEVPVMWPSWAAQSVGIVGVLEAGDSVTLLMSDQSLDEWKEQASDPIETQDVRRCQLTDALCYPGGWPTAPPTGATGALVVQGSDIRLGSVAASDPVVTESRLKGFLSTLKAWMDSHVHPTAPVGPPSPPTVPSPTSGGLSTSDVKAT